MTEQLGPFQPIWDAWNDANDAIVCKPLNHFRRAMEIQFDELEQHLGDENKAAAAREIIDMISIALNTMRWMNYQPEEVAEAARSRAEKRMQGKALSILDKYQQVHGI